MELSQVLSAPEAQQRHSRRQRNPLRLMDEAVRFGSQSNFSLVFLQKSNKPDALDPHQCSFEKNPSENQ